MAKLKGPLFSMGASQKLGDTLVYFPWKGLNVVRSYVIPSNPKTALQNTQRGYLIAAVAAIHSVMALAAHPVTEVDKVAWQRVATVLGITMTWFNCLLRQIVNQLRLGLGVYFLSDGTTTPGVATLAVSIWDHWAGCLTGTFHYGTSPSALLSSEAGILAAGEFTATLAGLTAKVKYYWQFRPLTPAAYVGCNSGIYYGTPT